MIRSTDVRFFVLQVLCLKKKRMKDKIIANEEEEEEALTNIIERRNINDGIERTRAHTERKKRNVCILFLLM